MTLSFKPALAKLATLAAAALGAPGNAAALIVATTWILAACSHETRPGVPPTPGNPSTTNAASAGAVGSAAAAASGAATAASGASGAAAATAPNSAAPPGPPPKANATTIDLTVGRNDTLDRIFRKLNLNLTDLANLRAMPGIKTHMDNLRLGESLHIVHKDDELDGFERRLNDDETLKVARGPGGLRADVLQNPLEGRTRTIRGVIDSSLFEAVTGAGAHDQTAVNLADIFQWDIDFVLDIQPRDSFTVTYRELYQNGVYVKDGPVLAASFVNQGRSYYAVRYVDSEGAARYFTPDGRSLHKAFLRAPVEFTRISSKFNSARYHPILNLIRAHKGIDYAAPMGTPVRAAGDGRVSYAGPKGGYGNVVELEHSRSISTVYGHLSRFAKGTRAGAHVTQGQVIAYVGMTGLATGPHLHYEYRVNGVFKNPQTVPLPDASPIEARFREDFLAKSTPLLATLEAPIGPALVSR
jgi:murein DD-endopeptidase MepM/ murein hydrolase activator NlpD